MGRDLREQVRHGSRFLQSATRYQHIHGICTNQRLKEGAHATCVFYVFRSMEHHGANMRIWMHPSLLPVVLWSEVHSLERAGPSLQTAGH
jgi:hypothetical protein